MALLVATAACNRPAPPVPVPNGAALSQKIVAPYLNADEALAADRTDGIKANAADISAAARTIGPPAAGIDRAAVQLASAASLEDARTKFGAMSVAIEAYMADQHLAPPAGVRMAFCPMVMKPWLQKDGKIRNPYYGSQMLTCGSFKH